MATLYFLHRLVDVFKFYFEARACPAALCARRDRAASRRREAQRRPRCTAMRRSLTKSLCATTSSLVRTPTTLSVVHT